MTQRPTTLRIAEPCPASWAAMTPAGAGRHCAACQQTVVDFTRKTDAEILATLRQDAGTTCGRLRPDQLGRPLASPAPAPHWRRWLGAVLAVGSVLAAGRAAAQARTYYSAGPRPVASPTTGQVPAEATLAAAPSLAPATGPAQVRGVVLDAATREALPGVTVRLQGTHQEVATDANGNFTLSLPTDSKHIILEATFPGYETTVKASKLRHAAGPLRLQLKMSHAVLGELAYVRPVGSFLARWRSLFS